MPAPIALIELVDQACRIGSASHMIRQALQVADEDDSVDWGAACAALIARVSRGSLPAGGSKEEEERDDERSRWYALVLCETLFIHHRPFRVGSLSRLRDLAAAALSDSTCVRERCLVTFRRWMARFPGEWRLQILPLYVRNAFHLEIPEDPSVARREAVSDGLASMEEVFLAKTSRLSDAVQELQTCFEIVIPDIGMNPASSGDPMLSALATGDVVDEFSDVEIQVSSDEWDASDADDFDEDDLQWPAASSTGAPAVNVAVEISRDLTGVSSSHNQTVFDAMRDLQKELKVARPELQGWKTLLESARKLATSDEWRERLWSHRTQVRYGVVASLLLRVEDAMWQCEVLIGRRNDKRLEERQETRPTPTAVKPIVAAPSNKRKTKPSTARSRIEKKFKPKR
ncbi:Uncharacterized protein PBTT_07596 [Plasmodiophora brassicae]|uniref:Uncharacterized protein n=1 Tax=Plasmodiophora brassicae TaxID=37360 RepID=A0A0G4IMG0_PLABS|nr:hypothetical protein PBRA_004953 [Plasmodiophora brassicae]SPQ99220.1 unnamed protein product [Plasmodiophora brassicae]